MTRRRWVPGLLVAAALALSARPALSQPTGQVWQPEQGRAVIPEELTVQALERQFDRFEIVEAQKALGMDDETFRAVAERMERMQAVRRRHLNQRRTILRELRALVGAEAGTVDEAAVTSRLTELGGLGVRQAQEMRRVQQAIDLLLTVRQRVQLRLFQERFERQKLDLLVRARLGRGRGGPSAPGR